MKKILGLLLVSLLLGWISTNALAEEILVDFEDPVIATNDFIGLNQDFFQVNPDGGRGNSGSASTTWFTRQNYVGQSFDFSQIDTSITVSSFFKLALNDPPGYQYGRIYGEVYLVPSPSELGGNINKTFVNFGIRYPSGGELTDNIFGGSLAASGGSFPGFSLDYPPGTFEPGLWYELKVTFTNFDEMIRYEITINEYDADGLFLIQTVAQSTQTTIDQLGLTKDADVYAGFSFQMAGAEVADDFSVSSSLDECQGMYSQAELDAAVTDAVHQAEFSKDLVITEKDQTIADLRNSIATLEAEAEADGALLDEQEILIAQLTDEIQVLKCSLPHYRNKKSYSDKCKVLRIPPGRL